MFGLNHSLQAIVYFIPAARILYTRVEIYERGGFFYGWKYEQVVVSCSFAFY